MESMGQISADLLSRLSEFVSNRIGLYFPQKNWPELERGIESAAKEFGFPDTTSCITSLLCDHVDRKRIEILSSYLTVGETYFYREKRAFEILEEEILPQIISSKTGDHQLRIWSAACCSGEEAYSIAMLLDRMLPKIQNWRITILATDINPHFLRKASEGIYTHWSFRDTPAWVRDKYFLQQKDGRFEVMRRIKDMVSFAYLNLMEDSYPSLINNTTAFDLIFCRNVLMYFLPENVQTVIHKLQLCLQPGGWLLPGISESSHAFSSELKAFIFPGVTFYKKDSALPVAYTKRESLEVERYDAHQSPPENYGPLNSDFDASPDFPVEGGGPLVEAEANFSAGDYSTAIEILSKFSVETESVDQKTIALLARSYANAGLISEARNWCEKGLAADRLNASLHYLLATICQEQDAMDEAIASLKRAVYLDQNFVLAYFTLGMLALKQNKLKEADKYFGNVHSLLQNYQRDEILPESDGITAGRLIEILESNKRVAIHIPS
jgi:chemotaxis protein methyltransferase CheR